MNCTCFQNGGQFQDELFEYLDGTLSASTQAEVEAHVAQCPACRQAVAAHKALAEQFQRKTEFLTLRPGLVNRVLSAVEEPPPRTFAAVLWRRWAWPAALAATVLVLAGLNLRRPFRPRVPISEAAPRPASASISLSFPSCDPTYTFRREKNSVIDALTCTPRVVEEKLSLSLNQKPVPQTPARKITL